MENSSYWKKRMRQIEAASHKTGEEAYKEAEAAFSDAQRELNKQIEKWLNRIADENGVSYEKARQMLRKGELDEFRWDVQQYIEKGRENANTGEWDHELENASARAHITRLDAMKLQLRNFVEEAYGVELAATGKALTKIYEESYYHTAYEVQKGVGVGWQVGGVNQKALDMAVRNPWAPDGKNFSDRIWENKTKMVGENKVKDDGAEEASLVYWVTGAEAGCAVEDSLMNSLYNGEYTVDVAYTQSGLKAALDAGKLIFHNVAGDVRVLRDINSLVTFADDKGEIFQDNKTVRVCDQIGNDIAALFNTKYMGKIPNDDAGRVSLWNDVVDLHNSLERLRAIENFSSENISVAQGESKNAVVITDAITVTGTMEQLYMTVRVA